MAKTTVSQPNITKAGTAEGLPFFSLNAEYTMKPGASLADMATDVHALLGSGLALLRDRMENVDGRSDEADFGVVYLLQQALAVCAVLHERMENEELEVVKRMPGPAMTA
jgi:hypothetical protein